MRFPDFLNKDDTIGVTACSCGVLKKIDKYEESIKNIKAKGFKIIETNNVRTLGKVSSDKYTRANELKELYDNNDVKLVAMASGGDFLYDMLNEVDFDIIDKNLKWISGSSDPTSLLYIITTKLDIATIYSPCNMSGFNIMSEYLDNYFEIIKGNLIVQNKFPYMEGESFSDVFDLKNEWLNINGDVLEEGVLIGGCIECLKNVIGTKFDYTKEFIDRYKDKGIIWYFDIFSMTSEDVYNTLLQFRDAGWFKYTKAVLIGSPCFPNTFTDTTYEDAIRDAITDIKVIYNFDVGHVKPSFTMINGAEVKVVSNDKNYYIKYKEIKKY